MLRLFGMSQQLDIFFSSNTLSLIFVAVASSSFNYALTPILIKLKSKNKLIRLKRLVNSYVNLFVLVFSVFSIIQIIFGKEISSIFFPGFTGEENEQLARMLAMQSVVAIFSILVGILNALNYTYNKLYRTAFLPLIGTLLQFLTVFWTYRSCGVYSLVIAAAINQLFLLLTLSVGFYSFYRMQIVFDRVFISSSKKILPLLFSSVFSKSDLLVNRYFASTLAAGAISSLHFGVLAVSVLSTFVNKGISIVSLRYFSVTELSDSHVYFYRLCEAMLLVSLFVAINVVLFSPIIFEFILSGDTFTRQALKSLYLVVLSLLGYLVGGILSSVIVNPFYTGGLTTVVSKVSISLQIVSIFCMVIFFKLYGFYALPIVMSIKSVTNSLVLLVLYNQFIHSFDFLRFSIFVLRLIFTVALILLLFRWLLEMVNSIVLIAILPIVYMIFFADFLPENIVKRLRVFRNKIA